MSDKYQDATRAARKLDAYDKAEADELAAMPARIKAKFIEKRVAVLDGLAPETRGIVDDMRKARK